MSTDPNGHLRVTFLQTTARVHAATCHNSPKRLLTTLSSRYSDRHLTEQLGLVRLPLLPRRYPRANA